MTFKYEELFNEVLGARAEIAVETREPPTNDRCVQIYLYVCNGLIVLQYTFSVQLHAISCNGVVQVERETNLTNYSKPFREEANLTIIDCMASCQRTRGEYNNH